MARLNLSSNKSTLNRRSRYYFIECVPYRSELEIDEGLEAGGDKLVEKEDRQDTDESHEGQREHRETEAVTAFKAGREPETCTYNALDRMVTSQDGNQRDNGNITYDPLRCFEIRYNLLNLASEVIGYILEYEADSDTSAGAPLCKIVYYAVGTRVGVKAPDDGYWTTRYIGSLIYEGEPRQLHLHAGGPDGREVLRNDAVWLLRREPGDDG